MWCDMSCVFLQVYPPTPQARYASNRGVYERFLFALRSYRDGQMSRAALCDEVAGLFADQHDLLRDFCKFIPDSEQPAVYATACTAQLTGLRVG